MGRTAGVNLTKAEIEALQPKEKLYRVPDATVRGLEIQVTPKGAMSWVMRFRVHGHQKTHTLGRWPELTVPMARKLALDLLGDLTKGQDPATKRREERQAATVNELARRFIKEHIPTLKKSTQEMYKSHLKNRILPAIGHMRAKDVTSSDLAALLSKVRADTPTGVSANRVRAVASKMFSLSSVWGLRPGLLNPAVGQVRVAERKKDRHLSDKELVALGAALKAMAPTQKKKGQKSAGDAESIYSLAFFRLALLTGMRKSEILGNARMDLPPLRWDSVDLNVGLIRLAHHKTERKVGTRVIPLSSAAVQLLDELPRILGSKQVFPSREEDPAFHWIYRVWERVKAKVPEVQVQMEIPLKDRVNIEDVTLHDLRRSFASLGARLGYPDSFTGALLGHSASTVTGGYARLGGDPLMDAVEAIGARMAALLDGTVDVEAEAKESKERARAGRGIKGA